MRKNPPTRAVWVICLVLYLVLSYFRVFHVGAKVATWSWIIGCGLLGSPPQRAGCDRLHRCRPPIGSATPQSLSIAATRADTFRSAVKKSTQVSRSAKFAVHRIAVPPKGAISFTNTGQ
jgi:hypothetical protein